MAKYKDANVAKAEGAATTDKAAEDAAKKRNAAKAAARSRIRQFMATCENAELKADLELVIGASSRNAQMSNVNEKLRNHFLDKGAIGENEIFQDYRMGRKEMQEKIRLFLKVPDPAKRIWVRLFPADDPNDFGEYRLVGKGEQAPKGWDGYVPVKKENIPDKTISIDA